MMDCGKKIMLFERYGLKIGQRSTIFKILGIFLNSSAQLYHKRKERKVLNGKNDYNCLSEALTNKIFYITREV